MPVAGRGVEAEQVLAPPFGIFQKGYCRQVGERDLLEQTLFCRVLVEGKKVGPKDKMEGFPLLDVQCEQEFMQRREQDGAYLCFSRPFLDFTTLYDPIECKTSILIDWRESIQIQVAVALARNGLGHSEGWRWRELGV